MNRRNWLTGRRLHSEAHVKAMCALHGIDIDAEYYDDAPEMVFIDRERLNAYHEFEVYFGKEPNEPYPRF